MILNILAISQLRLEIEPYYFLSINTNKFIVSSLQTYQVSKVDIEYMARFLLFDEISDSACVTNALGHILLIEKYWHWEM